MAGTINPQDIANAKVDIEDIGESVNEAKVIKPRYGDPYKSIPLVSAEAEAKIAEFQQAINTIVIDDGVPAIAVSTASDQDQQEINDFGGYAKYKEGRIYSKNQYVMLDNGDIVQSIEDGVTSNPNIDISGWVNKSQLDRSKVSTTYDIENLSPTDTRLLSDIYTSIEDAQLDYPFATSLDASLGWAVLQKQFNSFSSSTSALNVVSGTYYVNSTLSYSAKVRVDWNLRLELDGGSIGQYAIIFDNIDNSVFTGKITLACKVSDAAGPTNWSLRSWWDGLLFKRSIGADWSGLYVNARLKGQAVTVDGEGYNSNYMSLGFITGTCGSRGNDFTVSILSKNNSGNENNTDQRTSITLSEPILGDISGYSIKIGESRHLIVSNSGNSIVVTPWVFDTSTTASIAYGGMLKTTGDNANNLRVKRARGFESATTLIGSTQMGLVIDDFGAEYNEIALQLGTKFNSPISSFEVEQWYSEFNSLDIFDVRTSAQVYSPIKVNNEIGLTNVSWASNKLKLTPFNSAGVPYPNSSNILINIGSLGETLSLQNKATGINVNNSDYIYLGAKRKVIAFNDSHTFQIDCTAKSIGLGYNTLEINQFGQRGHGGVISTTLQCYSPYTIEGASSNSGRTLYLSYTAKPRKLFLQLVGTVIKVRELNDVMFTPVSALNISYGNDKVKFDSTTASKGTNSSIAGVMLSHNSSSDYSTFSGVEESWYYNPATAKIEHKIRSRQGATVSDWVDLVTEQMQPISDLNTSTATSAQNATKINEILSALRQIKLLKS